MLLKFLIVFGVSMVPLIELRGAIPIAASLGLELAPSYLISIAGNLVPIPFILIFVRLVLDFMKRRGILVGLVDWIERKAIKGAAKINKSERADRDIKAEAAETPTSGVPDTTALARRAGRRELGALVGLFLFVAIPLPGTGAWTGALVAALLGMNRLKAFFSIALGVLGAGVIMALISYGFLGALRFLL